MNFFTWMAWTTPTAIFFLTIASALIVLTLAQLRWPSFPRRGWLGLATTRGDRFFISLLCAALIHAAWLAVTLAPVVYATVISVGLGLVLLRWG